MSRWKDTAEERAENPLFFNRRTHQCCWPLWNGIIPLEEKRTCGALVEAGSKIPYCAEHLQRQMGQKLAVKTGGFFLKQLAKHGA